MAYVRINSSVEFDPLANTIRQDGQERPAGLAALGFSNLLEVQQQFRALAGSQPGSPEKPEAVLSSAPGGLGLRQTPAPNPWNYTGPAASNPYYTMPGTPLQDGFVKEYEDWVETARVQSGVPEGATYAMPVATEAGAREALRLVQQYVPDASLEATVFGAAGGPWRADKPSCYVVLPSGCRLNAAALLGSYYNQGWGVTALSDLVLRDELRWQTGHSNLG
jgi:hypothetical protein